MDLELIRAIESAAAAAWPPSIQEMTADGWILRATPGLNRSRCNHALPPARVLSASELAAGIAAAEAFARRNGIAAGIQVSSLELHAPLQRELDARGWSTQSPALVLAAEIQPGCDDAVELTVSRHADPEWLEAWERCDPSQDVDAHAATVLRALQGRALFARARARAVAIAVPGNDLVGIFSMAVHPAHRRVGLGRGLLRTLLQQSGAALAYLQVEQENRAAQAFYRRLGFEPAYRYCHRRAPA